MNLPYDELPGRARATLDYPIDPPLDLAARSLRAGRRVRRRRRVLAGVGSLTVIAVLAIAVPTLLPSHRLPQATVTGLAPGTPGARGASVAPSVAVSEAIAAVTSAEAAASGAAAARPSPSSTFPVAGTIPGASEPATVAVLPAHFLAAIGAGAERQTVVTTATGTRGRVLTPGSQALGVLSDGGATFWEPVGVGTDWQAVNVATGAVSAAPQFAGDSEFAIAPNGTVAAVRGQNLQVGATTLPFVEAPYPQWSPDSKLLVIEANPGIKVLDAALNVMRTLTAPSGCTFAQPHFRDDHTLVVAENCPSAGTVSLVTFDAASGRQLGRTPIVTGAKNVYGIVSLDIDSAGDVIASVGYGTPGVDGVVYTVTADGHVTREGTTDTYQVNWLPRRAQTDN